jgi:redox-sensing transcriptional repressor
MSEINDKNEKYVDDVDMILSQENDGAFEHNVNISRPDVSPAVVKRLPKYFRYLRQLIRQGKTRVSSAELSKMMNFTASQIRQDLNCFGGFGQQGYGYNVNYLYSKICEILGVGFGFRAALVGAGNLGRALAKSPMFEKRGVDVVAMFDVSEELIGKKVALVCNLKPAKLCGVESNGMILASGEEDVRVLFIDDAVELGERIR